MTVNSNHIKTQVMKGQVLGFWWTEKQVLNNNIRNIPLEKACEQSASELVAKMRFSMLALKGDFMDDLGAIVDYDGIKNLKNLPNI